MNYLELADPSEQITQRETSTDISPRLCYLSSDIAGPKMKTQMSPTDLTTKLEQGHHDPSERLAEPEIQELDSMESEAMCALVSDESRTTRSKEGKYSGGEALSIKLTSTRAGLEEFRLSDKEGKILLHIQSDKSGVLRIDGPVSAQGLILLDRLKVKVNADGTINNPGLYLSHNGEISLLSKDARGRIVDRTVRPDGSYENFDILRRMRTNFDKTGNVTSRQGYSIENCKMEIAGESISVEATVLAKMHRPKQTDTTSFVPLPWDEKHIDEFTLRDKNGKELIHLIRQENDYKISGSVDNPVCKLWLDRLRVKATKDGTTDGLFIFTDDKTLAYMDRDNLGRVIEASINPDGSFDHYDRSRHVRTRFDKDGKATAFQGRYTDYLGYSKFRNIRESDVFQSFDLRSSTILFRDAKGNVDERIERYDLYYDPKLSKRAKR